MTSTDTEVTPIDWAERIASAGSVLADNAIVADKERRLPETTIEALTDSGAFSILTPREYGGLGLGATDLFEAANALGYFCPAAAWVTVISNGSAMLLSRFPATAQERVYDGRGPQPLASVFVSPGGDAVREGDGFRISGRWPFASNILHSDWAIVVVPARDTADAEPYTGYALLHRSQFRVEDTWHTIGMRGTGSNTIHSKDQWIPNDQLVTAEALLGSEPEHRSDANAVQRLPPTSTMATTVVAPALGAARAALAYVRDKSATRSITYSNFASQSASGAFVHALGEAAAIIDTADLHLRRSAEAIDQAVCRRTPYPTVERGRTRSDASRAAHQCIEALTQLTTLHGTASFAEASPLGRLWRDVNTGARHALVSPVLGYEVASSLALGIPAPTTAAI